MYQKIFSNLVRTFEENDILIIDSQDSKDVLPNYFAYTDNQSEGEIIKKLCQI